MKPLPPPFISLILATLGRFAEVKSFVDSLMEQEFPLEQMELIVVDQNVDSTLLGSLLEPYQERLRIVHVPSARKGLSFNRNIGLALAQGEWVAFPDDDCTYYPDTLAQVRACIAADPTIGLWLGRIWDRRQACNVIRNWPTQVQMVHAGNFYTLMSSITLFTRRTGLCFDEQLGVGARWGANEDADLVLTLLEQGVHACYQPCIETWHPQQSTDVESPAKVRAYALGFGAFCRKHLGLRIALLFCMALGYHLLLGVLRGKRLRFVAFWFRLVGFWEMQVFLRKSVHR